MGNSISLKRLAKLSRTYMCIVCGDLLPNEAYVAEIHISHKHPEQKLEGNWFDDHFRNPSVDDIIMAIKHDWKFKKQYNPKCDCFNCHKARSFYNSQNMNKEKSQ